MEKKNLLYLVTVKVKAPEGYKPRVTTEHGIIVTPEGIGYARQAALKIIEEMYEKDNPKIKLKFQTNAVLYNCKFIRNFAVKASNSQNSEGK
jgi:hypothetical protein